MNQPLVSVLMPCHNCAPHVREAIASVLAQSYPHFELLICDDGSTDGSVEIINTIDDSRIRIFRHDSNWGYPHTMNHLFQVAQGEYVMMQDADDISHPRRIAKLLGAIASPPMADAVGSDLVKFYPDGTRESVSAEGSPEKLKGSFQQCERPGLTFGTLLMRRELCETSFRELSFVTRAQDIDWLFRISERYSFKNLNEELYRYRQHATSMSNSNDTESMHNMFFWPYICFITQYRREKNTDILQPEHRTILRDYLQQLIAERRTKDAVFWERHLAYRARKNGDVGGSLRYALRAIRHQPFRYGSYHCLIKVLVGKNL